MGGCMAVSSATASAIPQKEKRAVVLSDEEIARIVIDNLKNTGYGLSDLLPDLPIIFDTDLTLNQKVTAIWEATKDHGLKMVIKLAGSDAVKNILKELIKKAIEHFG